MLTPEPALAIADLLTAASLGPLRTKYLAEVLDLKIQFPQSHDTENKMKSYLPRTSSFLAASLLLLASSSVFIGTAQRTAVELPSQRQELQTREPAQQEDAEKTGLRSSLECCECLGKVTTLNISTGQSGPKDPLWSMNGGPAYTTPPYPGWITTLTPARWIQPVASPTPSPGVPAGNYKYTVRFNVPKCTIPSEVRLEGKFAADNGAKVSLDGTPVNSCPMPYCFKAPVAPVALSVPSVSPGAHTLEVIVMNEGGPSGLVVNAQLVRQCRREVNLP